MAKFQVDTLLSYEVMAENVIGEVISGATQYSYNPYFLLYYNFHIFVNLKHLKIHFFASMWPISFI